VKIGVVTPQRVFRPLFIFLSSIKNCAITWDCGALEIVLAVEDLAVGDDSDAIV
jgi:hypothetical protein